MISKEERAEWRNEAKTKNATEHRDGVRLLIALNAMESAEARAEQAEATIESWEHGSDCGTCPLQNEPACDEICSYKAKLIAHCAEERTRAEAAEREREMLAGVAVHVECHHCPLMRDECPTGCGKLSGENKQRLIEWARQQARGGEI